MTLPAYRLPPDIEEGAQGGPQFATVIQESVSGQEQRVRVWAKCRAKYEIGYSVMNSADPVGNYRAIVALFYAHAGRLRPFRFKDWGDYQAENVQFGTGNGSTTFQLSKTYDPSKILLGVPGTYFYTREIYLVAGPAPIIAVDGVPQTVTTHYTIGPTGLVTFVTPPSSDAVLTFTGEFDIPVRFDVDYLPVMMNVNDIANIGSVSLREVIGTAELA